MPFSEVPQAREGWVVRKLLSHLFLGLFITITAYPFAWMVLSSFKTNREIYQPDRLLPGSFDLFAYRMLFSGEFINFFEVLVRSILLAGGQAMLACFITAGAGFALAKGRFRGKTLLFGFALIAILYPKQAMSLSLFEWLATLGMTGTYYGLLFSGVASGLGVIFFMQVFRKIPDELIDLARVEGESTCRTFFGFLPLVKPALITYGILHFFLCWQDHLLPLLVLGSDQLTLPLALAKLGDSSYRIPEAVGLAAGVIAIIPMALLFGYFFRRIRSALSEWVVS